MILRNIIINYLFIQEKRKLICLYFLFIVFIENVNDVLLEYFIIAFIPIKIMDFDLGNRPHTLLNTTNTYERLIQPNLIHC